MLIQFCIVLVSDGSTPVKTMEETTEIETRERYGAIETGDGDLVIYDREETSAWLQSDHTVELAA